MTDKTPPLSVYQATNELLIEVRNCISAALVDASRWSMGDCGKKIDALIAAVRAEAGHRSLAQGERLIEWRARAEAAEAQLRTPRRNWPRQRRRTSASERS